MTGYKVFYVITDRKTHLVDVSAFEVRCIETVIGVDMYWGCERFSKLSEQAKIGHIEIAVYDHDDVVLGEKLEEYIIRNVIDFAKHVLGVRCIPVKVK